MKNKKIIDISDNRTLLSKFSYLYAKINRLMNHFKKAALSAFAGQAAFFMILSFFPFFMFLLSLFRYTPFTKSMLLKTASALVPEYFRNYLGSIINEIYNIVHNDSTYLFFYIYSLSHLCRSQLRSLLPYG